AQSRQGSLLERIEQLIDAGEVLAKDISYGSWSRFASQTKFHAIKARAFKAYCQILGLNWEEIVDRESVAPAISPPMGDEKELPLLQSSAGSDTQKLEGGKGKNTNNPRSRAVNVAVSPSLKSRSKKGSPLISQGTDALAIGLALAPQNATSLKRGVSDTIPLAQRDAVASKESLGRLRSKRVSHSPVRKVGGVKSDLSERKSNASSLTFSLNSQAWSASSNGEDLPNAVRLTRSLTSPYHNLPVRYHTALIGRDTEMTWLLERLARDRSTSHISIEGIGGAGKTSLVLEAAYRCLQATCGTPTTPQAPTFDAIIFTSAKQQHLIGNQILQRHKRERTLNDIFRAIFRTLECPGLFPADFEQQLECIQSRLQELHTLLIVDNLETLDDQEAVLSFLYELPPTVKVVITTRLRGAFGSPIYLEGLPVDEARRLIEHQAQEQRLQLKPEQFQDIYHRTSGLPLGIVYAIGQLSVYGMSADVLATRLTQASDLTQYCFEDSVQRLRGQPAHRLLMGLALFAKSASRDAIAQIALPDADSLNALAQLYQLRLVIQREERYDMHPLTREYARAELKAHSKFEQEARERWVTWYLRFSQAYEQQDWKLWKEYQALDYEWENLQAAIDWCIQQNRYEQVRQFWRHIKGYTYVHGYWHERLTWIDWLLQAAQQHQDSSMMAEALGDKGWTLTLMGKPEQLAQVDALFAQVCHLQEGKDLIVHLALTIDQAVLSIHQRKFDRAHQLLNQGKELLKGIHSEEPKRLRQQIRLYYYEAEVWFRTGQYEQAKIGYQQALEQAQVAQWQQVEVYILNWLADVALVGERNLDEAENLLNRSMPIALVSKDKRSIAFHKRSWAHLESLKGNFAEFQRWVIEAKASFESLGMLAEAQEMQSWLNDNF
ncbi:ATP-binding protein, partial [Allocoleopsis sp.]|uniref:ATP-binding protein n=1 Tax=Allocoleopsis sp. TaxID=3088169 RepID=UPI002FD02F36